MTPEPEKKTEKKNKQAKKASSDNLFKSLLSLLPGTNHYWCHSHDTCGLRTHNPEVARQTHETLGPLM